MSKSSGPTATLTPSTYTTILLHLSKHPTATVLGLLLGPRSTDTSNSTHKSTQVTHVVPLSHHWSSLSPMAEVGLALTTAYAETKGLELVGVYEAPHDVSTRTPSGPALRLAEKVAALSPSHSDALLLLVNNTTLLVPTTHSLLPFHISPPTSPAATHPPKPKPLAASALQFARGESVESVVGRAKQAVREARWTGVVDFDDHLVDPRRCWLEQGEEVGGEVGR